MQRESGGEDVVGDQFVDAQIHAPRFRQLDVFGSRSGGHLPTDLVGRGQIHEDVLGRRMLSVLHRGRASLGNGRVHQFGVARRPGQVKDVARDVEPVEGKTKYYYRCVKRLCSCSFFHDTLGVS